MTNRVGSSVSVVVPTYGNALGLEPLARDISEILQRENRTFEILFVNDGSPDATWDAIQRIHLSNPEVAIAATICAQATMLAYRLQARARNGKCSKVNALTEILGADAQLTMLAPRPMTTDPNPLVEPVVPTSVSGNPDQTSARRGPGVSMIKGGLTLKLMCTLGLSRVDWAEIPSREWPA